MTQDASGGTIRAEPEAGRQSLWGDAYMKITYLMLGIAISPVLISVARTLLFAATQTP